VEAFNINIIKIGLELEKPFKKAAEVKRLINAKECPIIINPLIDDINILVLKTNSLHQTDL